MNCLLSFHRYFRVTGLVAISLLATACAALPDLRYMDTTLAVPARATVVNAQGTLSQKQSAQLLNARDNRSPAAQAHLATSAAMEEAVTGDPLIAGNKVTLLYDGPQTMAAMMAAIASAKDHINLETYIFEQDEIGIRFADLLIARQRAGVQVNIIYDSAGTFGTPDAFFEKMRAAGVRLVAFNPINPLKLAGGWTPNNRDHRKILVVDGIIAFTGGVNISATYSNRSLFRSKSRSNAKVGWRDTHIQIEGPAVAALQTTGNYFPKLRDAGDKLVRVLASKPEGAHEIYKAYILAIQQARHTIHLTSAYFVPDAQILQALCDAAQRGVDVKIIQPGVSDSGLVQNAAHSFYAEMLASGIRIYQLQIAVLHAKTAVIDGSWATVGSTNIDTRSFLHNHEINVVVLGAEFGAAMENAFAEDLRNSLEITAKSWAQRPLSEQIKEWSARQFAYWL